MDNKGNSQPAIERWTARRKADLVLEIIKGQKTIVDAAREYDLKQSEIQVLTKNRSKSGFVCLHGDSKPYLSCVGNINNFIFTVCCLTGIK